MNPTVIPAFFFFMDASMASHAAREARRNFKIRYGIVRAQGPGPQWPLLVSHKPCSAGDCYESTLTVRGVQPACF